MYSTLPPVIAELVSNAWDADAHRVDVSIPEGHITSTSEILIVDDGQGMSDDAVRRRYLVIGRDRRKDENKDTTEQGRKVMGRKGIGKFSAFGIANEIEVETVRNGENSHFRMNYAEMQAQAESREILLPVLEPTHSITHGTKVTLRGITKFHNRPIDISGLRRQLARRFSIISPTQNFAVYVNGSAITPEERDLRRLLEKDDAGRPYLWEFDQVEILARTGWRVSGWIGAVDRTSQAIDGVQRGISIMARGKLVQEPFVFDAVVGQQFALSYLIGEL